MIPKRLIITKKGWLRYFIKLKCVKCKKMFDVNIELRDEILKGNMAKLCFDCLFKKAGK